MAKTVVGLFNHLGEANDAVQDLVNTGINRENISILANETLTQTTPAEVAPDSSADTHVHTAALDAGKGAIWGGAAGLLLGIGAFAVPGIGPVVAAGALATAIGSTLAGAGLGAVAGGLIGALVTAGVPESHAHFYTESVRRGSVLVVAQASDTTAERAAQVMRSHGAVDFDTRMDEYRDSGFRKFDQSAAPLSPSELETERARHLASHRDGTPGRVYDAIGTDFSTPGAVIDEEINDDALHDDHSLHTTTVG